MNDATQLKARKEKHEERRGEPQHIKRFSRLQDLPELPPDVFFRQAAYEAALRHHRFKSRMDFRRRLKDGTISVTEEDLYETTR